MSAYENVELPMTIQGKLNASEKKARTLQLLSSKIPIYFFSLFILPSILE